MEDTERDFSKCPSCGIKHADASGTPIAVCYCPVCAVPCYMTPQHPYPSKVECPGCHTQYDPLKGGGSAKHFGYELGTFYAPHGIKEGVLVTAG